MITADREYVPLRIIEGDPAAEELAAIVARSEEILEALGLADPVVTNRFLLWSIGAGAAGIGIR